MTFFPAYTEQLQVNTQASDLFQPYKPEEDENNGAFANILAGMMQKNETPEETENKSQLENPAETVVNVYEAENEGIEKNVNHFIVLENLLDSKIDFSDIEISEEQLFNLSQLEGNNAGTPETVAEFTDDLQQENFNVKTAADLKAELKTDFSMTEETASAEEMVHVSQTASAAAEIEIKNALKAAEESVSAKTAGKKESSAEAQSIAKNDKAEALFGKNASGEEASVLRNKQTDETPVRQNDIRSRSRRDRISFEVRDMRTSEANALNGQRSFASVDTSAGRLGGASGRELTMEVHLPNNSSGSVGQSAAQTTWETKAASSLENMLARELHQNLNGDIVRHASMALRDGGEGTIRLALRPESLGNVKIKLEMTENKITGFIVVESEEALNAFRREIASLEQAFRESGFTSADLNLSLAQDGKNQEGQGDANSLTRQIAASAYDESSSFGERENVSIVDVFIGRQNSVNMLA